MLNRELVTSQIISGHSKSKKTDMKSWTPLSIRYSQFENLLTFSSTKKRKFHSRLHVVNTGKSSSAKRGVRKDEVHKGTKKVQKILSDICYHSET